MITLTTSTTDKELIIIMRNIILGKTNVEVSAISLGTWAFGGPQSSGDWNTGWADQKDTDSQETLIKCYEAGIRHWDTADVYGSGRSEIIIGSMWNTLNRSDIFLATKTGYDSGSYNHFYHPKHMRAQIEKSLKHLQTDYVDLYYLHHCDFGENDEYFNDAVETVRKFQQEGKTRFIGLSDWNPSKILKFIRDVEPDVIQPYRNLLNDTYTSSGLKNWVEINDIGVCFFSPIMHGLLTGKYLKPTQFKAGDMRLGIKEFQDEATLQKINENSIMLQKRFKQHPNPVMHGIVDTLLTDSNTGCVLLGQRNEYQANIASTLGVAMSEIDTDWVKNLYKL